jgi:hypothetical protein
MVAREPLATVAVGGGVTIEAQPTPADVARVTKDEPRDNMQPVLWLNALLSGYAGLQLLNAITAFDLLQEGYGEYTVTEIILSQMVLRLAIAEFNASQQTAVLPLQQPVAT